MVILRLENGMEVLGLNKKTIISKKKISGLSILEAIVSTAIIGIGFVAILQMTNYSVQSIQVSSERTKANYLTNMIAEDVLVNLRLSDDQGKNFSEILAEGSGFKSSIVKIQQTQQKVVLLGMFMEILTMSQRHSNKINGKQF